jgi:post-segregation antitoxin (ccd killing protein)
MGNPKLRNRVIPNSAVDKELYNKLRELSKETKIPISRLLDKAIELLLEESAK